MTTLNNKLEKVKNDHAREVLNEMNVTAIERRKIDAFFLLGRITQTEYITQAIAAGLGSQAIRALHQFGEEKMYELLGYKTFAEFLDNSPHAPMTRHQFYERLKVLMSEGDALYDLLTEMGVSISTRKLLTKGERRVEVDGDELVIGTERVPIDQNPPVIRQLIKDLAAEIRDSETERERIAEKLEKAEAQNERGREEYNDLRRRYDLATETSEFDRCWTAVQSSLHRLGELAADLPVDERDVRGEAVLKQVAQLTFNLRDAFGLSGGIDLGSFETRERAAAAGASFEDRMLAEFDIEEAF